MGYLMMCVLSTRARRCSSCVLPFLWPRGTLSAWCVERAVVAATLQGVPRARQCARVVRLLCMVIRPARPRRDRPGRPPACPRGLMATTGSATLETRRTLDRGHPAAVDLARPGRANGHPADQATRKRLERSRTMWKTEDALQEIRAEGRAIDPAAVERMFDATRGAHISPGELERIWRGQSGPPAGPWYCTGIDWAQQRHSTVAAVVRCEITPLQLVAVYRAQRRSWLSMTEKVGALLDAFPAFAAHDQLQGVTLVGRVRTDLFRCCGEDDLFGSGHPPETVVAPALASHAFKTGRRPSAATPAGAPAGGTR